VRGSPAEGLKIRFAGSVDVGAVDRRERDQLDGIDFDLVATDSVSSARPYLRPPPERHGDIAGENVATKLRAEVHAQTI